MKTTFQVTFGVDASHLWESKQFSSLEDAKLYCLVVDYKGKFWELWRISDEGNRKVNDKNRHHKFCTYKRKLEQLKEKRIAQDLIHKILGDRPEVGKKYQINFGLQVLQ